MSMIKSTRAQEYIKKKDERSGLRGKLDHLRGIIKEGTRVHLCVARGYDRSDSHDCGYDHYMNGNKFSFVPTEDNLNHLIKGLESQIAALDSEIASIEAGN